MATGFSEARTSTRVRIARALALAAVGFGLVFYVVGDVIKPGYSGVSQFISELNASGSAWAWQMTWYGFVPLGLLLALFLLVAQADARVRGASRLGWWLLWSQPIAFIGVGLAPCDLGCPIGGSPMQMLHDLLGVTTYFAGALGLGLLALAPAHPRVTLAVRIFLASVGAMFIVLFVAMLVPEWAAIRGLLQRAADALLGAALVVVAWTIVRPEGASR